MTGSLLAIFLLFSNFSSGRPITLIGYSLGTVVMINCCRVLKAMYRKGYVKAGRLIHDVQLWAGAYVIDAKKKYEERMRTSYHLNIVNGRIVNLHSAADQVLTYG